MRYFVFILFFLFLNPGKNLQANGCSLPLSYAAFTDNKPNPVWLKFFKKQKDRKKIIASALAFPFPFGWIGIHRLYLGSKPYIPLIYAGTLGGCLGILPMIDFINLVSNKDISRFRDNPHIFMWVDNEIKK